jgi:hypothetical protein
MARELNLTGTNQVTVVTREEVVLETDKISIDSITDTGLAVTARVSFFNAGGYSRELTLWEGQAYVDIGNWTDADVDLRLKELLNVA